MPTHDTDSSGFIWAMVDDDGNISQAYHSVPEVKVISESYFAPETGWLFSHENLKVTINLHVRNTRGLTDALLGKNTPAAGRYIRNTKRWKEKQRRRRLKGGMIHGAD